MKTTLYVTNSVLILSSSSLRAVMATLEWLGWPEPQIIVGIEPIARLTRGRLNPASDFALLMPNNAIVRNPVDLCSWINSQGLVPL